MTPHAEYHSRYPIPLSIPLSVVLYPRIYPVTKNARAQIHDMWPTYQEKSVNFNRYLSVLSATEWKTTKDIAEVLGVSQQAVSNYLRTRRMKKLVDKRGRKLGSTHWLVYRLK